MAKKPTWRSGFEEGQAPFLTAAQLSAIHDAYARRCAFTGLDLTLDIGRDPAGAILHLGGISAAPGTAITASLEAIYAYERGHLALGQHFEFLIAMDRIDPEYLERLNPIGRLTLPADARFYPSPALLKVHREEFAEGLID